jgi:F-type H+-transporting ATPase subunit gamma
VVCSSDRGLCGAIHSSLSRTAKKITKANPQSTMIAIIGDKAKPQIAREARKNIFVTFSQVGKSNPSFSEAISLADGILALLKSKEIKEFKLNVLYNRFQSVISYSNTFHNVPTASIITNAPKIVLYAEEEPMSAEMVDNFVEFSLANLLFWGLVEGRAAEMASRRMAMENATKNSEQIVQNLTMRYNRTRQAVITNELVDIITGASAL